MKKFILHVAYITVTIKDYTHLEINENNYEIEAEVQPKVTPKLLEKIREAYKPEGGKIAILGWQWYDEI